MDVTRLTFVAYFAEHTYSLLRIPKLEKLSNLSRPTLVLQFLAYFVLQFVLVRSNY